MAKSSQVERKTTTLCPAQQEVFDDLLEALEQAATLPAQLRQVDITKLAAGTEGLTGSDLKSLIQDGKILYAYDKSRNRPLEDIGKYFERAVTTIRSNKEKYAEAEAKNKMKTTAADPFSFMRNYYDRSGDSDDSPA